MYFSQIILPFYGKRYHWNMDLHILSSFKAEKFMPSKPTYALRIFSSNHPSLPIPEKPKLQASNHYIGIGEYTFDDNEWRAVVGPVSITEEIADSIVQTIEQFRHRMEALIVHCGRGINRSPAVAIALNDIFHFGHDSDALKKNFPQFNKDVYRAIKSAWERYISHP